MSKRPDIQHFQQLVKDYFNEHGRELPWRVPEANGNFDTYKILVSEVMLQQTQVSRVIPKYQAFIKEFPTVTTLSSATLAKVLIAWNGLGYNRRAQYLHQASKQLISKPQPWTYEDLISCRGVGANTAAATCAYAHNQPFIFIETNVRTAFIHYFFTSKTAVDDKDIAVLLQQALNGQQPRTFYWALMDYGSHLKATTGNAGRRSKHYSRQSSFAGSRRQLRGQIVRLLAKHSYGHQELLKVLADERAESVIADLANEGMIARKATIYQLK